MDCAIARESLSARIDGEREPVPAERVDEHLAGCTDCCAWYAAAAESARRLSVRSAVRTPDLTANILAAAGAVAPRSRWQRARRWVLQDHPLRAAVLVLGGLQILLGVGQLLGMTFAMTGHAHGDMDTTAHLFNETTAWSIAVGIGLIVVGLRPSATTGIFPLLATFVGILLVFVAVDGVAGNVTLSRASSHLVVLVAVAVVGAIHLRYRDRPEPPTGSAVRATEVAPPDTSSGRRRRHVHLTDDPAA